MKTFNFSANWVDFGEWEAKTLDQAKDDFASDSGYKNWDDMVYRSNEFGGNTVEIKEVSQ